MTTEDFRADLDQGREYEKALVRQELEDMERAAERRDEIKRAKDVVVERVDHLMNVTGQGDTFYGPTWMEAYRLVKHAHQSLRALEAEEEA